MKNIVLFWTFFIILLAAASMAVKPSGGEVYDIINTDRKLANIGTEKDDTIDVMFAGDSLIFRGLSPLQIWGTSGITSYCLSEGAMRLCDQCALLKGTYSRQHPGIIVLEPNMMFSASSPYKDDYAIPTNFIEKLFPIFHYHTFYKAFKFSGAEKNEGALLKGFEPSYDVDPYTKDADYMSEEAEKPEIPVLNKKYLSDIVDFCKEKDIELMVMAMPSPKNYDRGVHEAVQEWADGYGLEFLDLNLMTDEMGINWETDTKDRGEHLNFEGSKKVTAYVSDYLRNNYELEDHRKDAYYSQWNTDYDEAGIY